MEPTPIEDLETRRVHEAVRRGNPWIQLSSDQSRELARQWAAKMAHDCAMRRALWRLEAQDDDRRFLTRLAWWTLGTMTAIVLIIATQCTGEYGGRVIDDPDHYSRQSR